MKRIFKQLGWIWASACVLFLIPAAVQGGTSITWAVEDWDGNYGAIARDVAVTAGGSRIYVAWNVNFERIESFDATGDGTPIWVYDVLENGAYNLSGDLETAVSDDGEVVVAAFDKRYPTGSEHFHSMVFRLNPADGTVIWSVTLPAQAHEPLNTERMKHVEISADGGTIAVAATGYRSDPEFEPFHFYIYDASGQLLHTFEIPDPDGDILYFNDMKLTSDGSRLVADFRRGSNPSHLVKVWALTTFTELQSFTINLSPPQNPIGLSGDGRILTLGDLKGHFRVYEYVETKGGYQLLWQYNIPPHTYYAWIDSTAVSRDGSVVAMGSYQPTDSGEEDYLYVFRTDAGPEILYRSPDFGGSVASISLSDDGSIIAAASYGPLENPETGMDLLVYSTTSGMILFTMDGTFPGSLMQCAVDATGDRIAAGGKRVHAFETGSGGWAYSIDVDVSEPTPTPTATATPTSTPTATPSPTPTATCPESGAEGRLNKLHFHSGDPFVLEVFACNGGDGNAGSNPVFVILDVYGTYYFAPGWTEEVDFYRWTVSPCDCLDTTVLEFTWPDTSGHADGLYFYVAMTDPGFSKIIGEISILEFGW